MPPGPQQTVEILHVDDQPDFTELTGTFLERRDDQFTVETATSAEKGLEIVRDRPPDCIVSDYNMPGLDGIEFLRAVRERNPDLPFILFTGRGSEEVASDAISAGVTDYLQKGSSPEQYDLLANRIHNAVQARHDAQRAARQEQLMRLTEFTGNTGGWELDRESNTLRLTAGTRRIIGRPHQTEIALEEAITLFHPDDRADIRQTLDRAFETGKEMHRRWRLQPGDNGERLLDMTITPVVEDGVVSKLRGAGHDITERREYERAARHREEQLALFFDESPLGAIQWDEDFRFERLNRRAEEILGYDETELRGEPWETIVADHDRDHVGDAVEKLLEADGGTHVINRNVRKDGEVRTCEWHNRAVVDSEGNVQSIFSKFQDVTDRERRKRELQEYETIIEALTDAVYVLDEEGRFTYVNEEFVALVGYDRETILGNTPSLIKDDDAVERAEQELGRLLSSDGPDTVTFEVRVQPRDGDPIVCEDHMGVLPYEGDQFNGSVGTLRDITRKKERERQLRNERDRFRSVFNDAFDAMVIANDDGEYIEVNERATDLFGLSEAELVGRSIEEFAPDEFDWESAWEEFQQSQRERDTFPLVRPDGTERLVEYAASNNIVPGQHLSVLRDITQRRRRERRFQALVEESNDIISIVDADGRYQYQSPSLERILGYDPDDTIGDTVLEYVHPDDRETALEQFNAWVEEPSRMSDGIEYRVRHADGSWRWMEAQGNDQLENPAVEGYVFNSRDITERKERQQQLNLLGRVLRHNMRNDMSVIRGAAETIRDRTTDTIASSARRIIETSDQVIETVEKEREIAKLLQEPPDLEEITVGSLLRHAVSGIRADYPDATVTVECPDDVTIRAIQEFEEAIVELLDNAIVHSDAGSPEVVVSVVQTAESVRIEVIDSCPRIPEMERDILLGNDEETPLYHGSGLGLYLVRLVVSRSGGSITFEQDSPTGNIVALELPA